MAIGISTTKKEREQQMARHGSPDPSNQINMIGEGTVLEGTLRARGDVRVSGRVVGRLEVAGKVIVAQEGSVEGELDAQSADIAGAIDGHIQIAERIVLKSTARVDGDIKAGRLVVEEGAVFAGQCIMEARPGARTITPTPAENGKSVVAGEA